MDELEIAHPEEHIVVARREYLGTLLVKRTPFSTQELQAIEEASDTFWFPLVYTPTRQPEQIFVDLVNSTDRENFHRAHGLECGVSSSTDNQPFFFFCEQTDTLIFLITIVSLLAGLLILAPLIASRGRSLRELVTGYSGALLYFACLGAGFLMVESVLIQRFVLFLGLVFKRGCGLGGGDKQCTILGSVHNNPKDTGTRVCTTAPTFNLNTPRLTVSALFRDRLV